MIEQVRAEFHFAANSLMEMANSLTESLRVKKVISLNIINTPPEEIYDDIVALAAKACNTEAAVLTFIDDKISYQKANLCGLGGVGGFPREMTFCNTAIKTPTKITIVKDATLDDRFKDHPMVINGQVRFYAGVPLIDTDGLAVGVLCVVSNKARDVNDEEIDAMSRLARIVVFLVRQRIHDRLD